MNTNLNQITIKSLKLNLTFSRETYCFTAKVFNGNIEIGYAENDGHGGCTFIHFKSNELANQFDRNEIESRVDELVHESAKSKDVARIIKKIRKDMNDKLLFIKEGESNAGVYSYCKHNGTIAGFDSILSAMKAKYPNATFLNGRSDEQLIKILGL